MSNLNDNLANLAQEDNQYFIKRSYGLIANLNDKLAEYAILLVKELESLSVINKCQILFIPISHKYIFDSIEENHIKKDILNILEIEFKEGDIIVIGETLNGNYTLKNRESQILSTVKKLQDLKIIPFELSNQNNSIIPHLHCFEKAIIEFAEEREIPIYGVESIEGAIISTALESQINFIKNDLDDAFRNELKFRIGIEGRTRLSLSRANNRFKDAKRIIFFQGALHLEGVKGWCVRNQSDFKAIVPNILKVHFQGKNLNLKFQL